MKASISCKLKMMTYMSLLPMAVLIIFQIGYMLNYSNKNNQIVQNITDANSYNLSFKYSIDYAMLNMIINTKKYDSMIESGAIDEPYAKVEEVRQVFKNLANSTISERSKSRSRQILKTLSTLEDRMNEICEDTSVSGNYDLNITRLEDNIHSITKLVQETIQEYIYYEAQSLETIRRELSISLKTTLSIVCVVFLFIIFFSWLLSQYFIKGISSSINELCSVTEKVGRGDFTVVSNIDTNDELMILSDSFNSMIIKIENLVEDVKAEQLNLRITELRLLQAQINPHFLYNTLDTIVWMAEDKQSEEVISMVTSLSEFMRTTLSKGEDMITIKEEISHVRSYLEIQQFRYRDILEYEIDVEDGILSYHIPKLTLQPIVENALYHGIKNKRGKGIIKITGIREEDKIIIKVMDTGIGMNEEALQDISDILNGKKESKNGFGLYNVNERLRLTYGEKAGIWAKSTYGEGTMMKVVIFPKM